jgi:hypothetical protein
MCISHLKVKRPSLTNRIFTTSKMRSAHDAFMPADSSGGIAITNRVAINVLIRRHDSSFCLQEDPKHDAVGISVRFRCQWSRFKTAS